MDSIDQEEMSSLEVHNCTIALLSSDDDNDGKNEEARKEKPIMISCYSMDEEE